jgi:hypothetical protein
MLFIETNKINSKNNRIDRHGDEQNLGDYPYFDKVAFIIG